MCSFSFRVYLGVVEGNGTALQYSCLENPMDGGTWQASVHGVAKSWIRLSDFTYFSLSCTGEESGNPLQCSCLENPRDGGAWWAAIYGVAPSRTWLKWLSSSSSRFDIGKARQQAGDSGKSWCFHVNEVWRQNSFFLRDLTLSLKTLNGLVRLPQSVEGNLL